MQIRGVGFRLERSRILIREEQDSDQSGEVFRIGSIEDRGGKVAWRRQIGFRVYIGYKQVWNKYNYVQTVACFLSSRTDLLCSSPRITAWEALSLVTHLVSYRTKLHLQLGALKEEFNPSWEYKPCTAIPVFYSTRCEDWTAMEDTSQESFQGSQLSILHMGCSYG